MKAIELTVEQAERAVRLYCFVSPDGFFDYSTCSAREIAGPIARLIDRNRETGWHEFEEFDGIIANSRKLLAECIDRILEEDEP